LLRTLLDRSIVLDFDRTGFRRHRRAFVDEARRAPQHALITGGTSGIGLAAAEALVQAGSRVTVWGRDPARGQAAAAAIGAHYQAVDLGDLAGVADAARDVPPVDALVLNAGAMPLVRTLTPSGHEAIWGAQVLGHALLSHALAARGALAPEARVLWVSSGGMYAVPLDLSDLRREAGYARHTAYANAKRAQVMLAERFAELWPARVVGAMHPGWVDTGAVQTSMPVFYRLTRPILRTPDEGADTITWFLTQEPAPPTGRFWFDRAERPTHLRRATRPRPGDADALWGEVTREIAPYLEPRR
jgi:NAD(P)-dependent dehydrogenase (short-subunit alcohol dehydrogenase family)